MQFFEGFLISSECPPPSVKLRFIPPSREDFFDSDFCYSSAKKTGKNDKAISVICSKFNVPLLDVLCSSVHN